MWWMIAVGVAVAWAVLCVIATCFLTDLARRRGCDGSHGAAGIFGMCFFLTPLFAAVVVGCTPADEGDGGYVADGGHFGR